jgi:hypothetical protein
MQIRIAGPCTKYQRADKMPRTASFENTDIAGLQENVTDPGWDGHVSPGTGQSSIHN